MKKKNVLTALLILAVLCTALTGCGGGTPATDDGETAQQEAAGQEEPAGATAEQEAEEMDTGDAALDDPRNQDGIGERELLVVSFGTSYNDSRRLTIGGIESALAAAFPDWSVRRGFTSQMIINHIQRRDGVSIDNVGQSLDRAAANGVKTLLVQPTHLMDGYEYHDLAEEVGLRAGEFDAVVMGKPLLSSDEDFSRIADAIVSATAEYDDGETAICFMGHGTEADSNGIYEKLQGILTETGREHYYIGTVEAAPSVEDVLSAVQAGNYRKVVLEPLMIVAGDHAKNDMAGDDPDSWKSIFESAGYEVTCVLRGLGEMEDVQAVFVDHVRAALDALETGEGLITPESVLEADTMEGPLVTAESLGLSDGAYTVEVTLSGGSGRSGVSSPASLTVQDGACTALIQWSSPNYDYMKVDGEIYLPVNADGDAAFEIPVAAFDRPISVIADTTAMSQPYEIKYALTFDSSAITPA